MDFKFIVLVTVIVLLFSVMSGCIEEGKEGPLPTENQTSKETSKQKESLLLIERIVPENEEHKTTTNEYISSFEKALEEDVWAKELWNEIKDKVSKFKSEDIKKNPEVQREVAEIVFDVISRKIESEEGVFNLSDVLKTKKADCVGYSQVYWIICKKLGLNVGVVSVHKDNHGEYLMGNESHVCNVLILSNGTEILVDLGYDEFDIKHKILGDKIVSKEEVYSVVLVKSGALSLNLNKFSEAEKEYREAIRINPNDAEAHAGLGYSLYKLNKFSEAEKEYMEAIRINPNFAYAHNNLGILLAKSNKFSEAEKEYMEAIKINPNFAYAHNNLGILLAKSNKFSEAEKEYMEAIKINPNDAEAHNNLGHLLYSLNRFEEAEKELREAIKINPNLAEAHNNLGDLLRNLNRFEEAEKELREAIKINPNLAEAHNNLGILLKNLNKFEEAEKEYMEVIRIDPNIAEAHNNLGILLYKLNKFSEAEKEYSEAIRIKPDFADAHYNLGALLYDLHRLEEAKNEFRTAAKLYREQGAYESANEIEEFLRYL